MNKIAETLRTFEFFENIGDEELNFIAERLDEIEFPAGSTIIKEGDDADSMFILIDGEIDVLRTTPFGDEYLCATLLAEFHCTFGEMAMIDKDKRSATIKAKTNCKCLEVKAKDFNGFCKIYPAAGVELLKIIAINMARNLRNENENLRLVYQALIEEIEQI